MTVWMQWIEAGRTQGLIQSLEQMPGFVYLHLLESPDKPHRLALIYWQDEVSMQTWSDLTRPCCEPQIFSLQRSLGPEVL